MANVGVSGCPCTSEMQSHCPDGILLSWQMMSRMVDGQPIVEICPIPLSWAKYTGDGQVLAYDDQNQNWASDASVGYPSVALWCDGDGTTNTPFLRITYQNQNHVDVLLYPWPGGDDSTHKTLYNVSPFSEDCYLIVTLECLGGDFD